MTTTFNSLTQFDNKFNQLFANQQGKKGFSCSFFSLLSAWSFLIGEQPDKNTHERNINNSVKFSKEINTSSGITFIDLVSNYSSLKQNDIMSTTVDLILQNIISWEHMFNTSENRNSREVTIFLKNEKYFIVMSDENGYYFRDCHESTQYDFKTAEQLIQHLVNSYQFTQKIDIDGIEYPEYSGIEFIRIDNIFDTLIVGIVDSMDYVQEQVPQFIEVVN
jgi:hypothetical protein